MLPTAVVVAVAASAFVAGPAAAQPPQWRADIVEAVGSGCPTGDAIIAGAPDARSVYLAHGERMSAGVGPDALPTDFRKNCRVTFQYTAPPGLRMRVWQADITGYHYLLDGATARLRHSVQHADEPVQTFQHDFAGPADDYWLASDPIAQPWPATGPCGGVTTLTVTAELRVSAGTSDRDRTSLTTLSPIDAMGAKYHLAWEDCETETP